MAVHLRMKAKPVDKNIKQIQADEARLMHVIAVHSTKNQTQNLKQLVHSMKYWEHFPDGKFRNSMHWVIALS